MTTTASRLRRSSTLTAISRRLNETLPDSRLVEIPGHAHEAYLTAPATLAKEILAFADDHPHKERKRGHSQECQPARGLPWRAPGTLPADTSCDLC